MTERLTTLLSDEADHLDVPAPPAADVITRGRSLRRRHQAGQAVAGVAALAVLGSGFAYLQTLGDERGAGLDAATTSEAAPVRDDGAVFTIGTTVYLDSGETSAVIDDRAVKSLYYTSAGVLVRHGDNPYSDGGGPQRFSLVTPDGAVRPLGLVTEETVHATDPTQPYLAYAEDEGRARSIVVVDVRTETEVARVPVPQARADFAPVALDGDRVYLGDDRRTLVIDWRTGEVSTSELLTSEIVAGGNAVDGYGENPQVIDAVSGEVVLSAEVEPGSYAYFTLSPDGSSAMLSTEEPPTEDAETTAYDVATGTSVTVPGAGHELGWTAGGDLFKVSAAGVLTTCVVTTGDCSEAQLALDTLPDPDGRTEGTADDLVLGGRTYES